jgi:DNA-3-methyladenine glycosylase II
MSETSTIVPRGPFSLARAATFGFGPRTPEPFDGALRLAFAADGSFAPAGVVLREGPAGIDISVEGEAEAGAVERQVARILSLDHDGEAWPEVGRRDPTLGELQRRHDGLRPVLFHSPYEAAAWAILSARRRRAQALTLRARLSERLGTRFELAGRELDAFPPPERLLEDPLEGLPGMAAARLRGVAEAALSGRLEAEALRALGPDGAIEQLLELPGIGPFYAWLVAVRAVGFRDVLASSEPRLLDAVALVYGLEAPPDEQAFERLAEPWRPYRTWAGVLVRVGAQELRANG